ncbi:MAG: carboxymuconolactone decarboxylase family protein [Anaerolineae bacterium]
MAFFEYVPEDQVPPEVRDYMEHLRRRGKAGQIGPMYYAFAKYPRLLKALVQAVDELIPVPNRFGAVQGIAAMLIAHSRGCRPCFDAQRAFLLKLGYDEAALNTMCQTPAGLPLSERERRFVEFTFRVARDPEGLKPEEFREMERTGFSKDEILEMIGVAAFWNFNTTLHSAVAAGLREG